MDNNPLKAYFRRPAIYLKLPSEGKYYPQGSVDIPVNGEVAVYPMTAVDEITTKTPDALFNGSAVVEIIKSCIPSIKDPWEIPLIDLDPILVAIRTATNGNNMDITSKCPACEEEASYGINLGNLLSTLQKGKYDEPLILQDLSFKFKPLAYKQINKINQVQFEIQTVVMGLDSIEDDNVRKQKSNETMQKLNDLSVSLVSETIESITTPSSIVAEKEFIIDFLKNCEKQTFESLRNYAIKMRESSEIKPLKMKCIHCQHDYDQSLILNPTDFFA
jgi:hypothetical protein